MDGETELEFWTCGEADRGTPDGGGLDRDEHPGVWGGRLCPVVVADELVLEDGEETVGASIGSAQGVCSGERDVCACGPVVHVGDIAGEDDLGLHGEREQRFVRTALVSPISSRRRYTWLPSAFLGYSSRPTDIPRTSITSTIMFQLQTVFNRELENQVQQSFLPILYIFCLFH